MSNKNEYYFRNSSYRNITVVLGKVAETSLFTYLLHVAESFLRS